MAAPTGAPSQFKRLTAIRTPGQVIDVDRRVQFADQVVRPAKEELPDTFLETPQSKPWTFRSPVYNQAMPHAYTHIVMLHM